MESLREKIYQLALAENPGLKEIAESEVKAVIKTGIIEIEALEKAIDAKINSKIKALWVFSGPGTYDDVFVNDRYKDVSWNMGMDRSRITYAENLINNFAQNNQKTPTFIYNGSDQQNDVLRKVVKRGDIKILKDKIIITGNNLKNTVDQIKRFIFPESLHEVGGEVGLISHAPHLMRIIHILNKYQVIPKDMTVRLFPIATPESGLEEYKIMEIKGLLYYIFISGDATTDSYPYVIHEK